MDVQGKKSPIVTLVERLTIGDESCVFIWMNNGRCATFADKDGILWRLKKSLMGARLEADNGENE